MEDKTKFELCLKEVELVQGHIARYDSNGLAIKSWCLATFSAISAYAFTQQSKFIAGIAMVAIVGFAIIELVYRCFQRRFIRRAVELENILRSEDISTYKFGLTSSAIREDWAREIPEALKQAQFVLLYLLFFLLSVVEVVAIAGGWFKTA